MSILIILHGLYFCADISAHPDSVNVLEGIEHDTRTPDKLIDGHFDTLDGRHMWLAPILPSIVSAFHVLCCKLMLSDLITISSSSPS